MKATELLKSDHRNVESLFAACHEASGPKKAAILEQIRAELDVHAQIEEEIFYPALQKQDAGEIKNAYEDHKIVKGLLASIVKTTRSDSEMQTMLEELEDLVDDHVEEEEEVLFAEAEELGAERLNELGEQLQTRKQELLHEVVPS